MSRAKTKSGIILVIEDEPDVRDFIKTALRHDEYELYFAVNGQEGISLMKGVSPVICGNSCKT